ncbi:MAG: LamG-like jellyroll fold domain-containing protein [archaeon]|nr:LamG-like jellyroll fold domain-containing protein [archaeon]
MLKKKGYVHVYLAVLAVSLLAAPLIFSAEEGEHHTVYLEAPENESNTNSDNSSLQFIYNHTGDLTGTVNCTLYLDGIHVNYTASVAPDISTTAYSNSSFGEGAHWWWVNCSNGTESESSADDGYNYTFTSDYTEPRLNFTPPTEPNGTTINTNWTEVNITITETNLGTFKFNWNSTDYRFYDDSLVLAMNFNNNPVIGENSTKVVDISKYGNDGTITPGTGGWTTDGKFNGAYDFDGNSTYIDCGNDSSLSIIDAITIEAWVKADILPFACTGTASYETPVASDAGSEFSSAYASEKAHDGSTGTSWYGASGDCCPNWIWFDLGSKKCISEVQAIVAYQSTPQTMTIQVSDDASEWTDAWIGWTAISMGESWEKRIFPKIAGRYIRLYITSSDSNNGNIMEFKAKTQCYDDSDRRIIAKQNSYEFKINRTSLLGMINNGTLQEVSSVVSAGQWYHSVLTYNGSSLKLHLNGNEVDSKAVSGAIDINLNDLLMGSLDGSSSYFNGTTDEVRIYNRAISAEETQMHYNSEFRKYNPTQYRFCNNITNLTDGTYTYYGWANDAVGNSNQTDNGNLRYLIVDFVPTTTATAVKDDSSPYTFGDLTNSAYVNVTLSCDDGAGSGCSATQYCTDTDDSCTPGTTYSTPVQITTEGTSYIRFRSNDTLGNLETTKTRTIKIDTISPILDFTLPTEDNGTIIGRNWAEVNITITEPNLDTFKFNWNGTDTFYDDSLILAMNFNNDSAIGDNSTHAVDISRYGNDGTFYGTGGANNLPQWTTTGKYGKALNFDGVDDYVGVGDDDDSLDLADSFTIEGFFRPGKEFNKNSDYYQGLFDKGSYQMFLDKSDGKLKFYLDSGTADGWSAVGLGMDYRVESLEVCNGELYAGGGFIDAGGSSANFIAKWNGTNWGPLGSGMDNNVISLEFYNGELHAGGYFSTAGGNSVNYSAKWNGTDWSPLGLGTDGDPEPMAVHNGELYVGGYFSTAGGSSVNYIAKWNGTGWSPLGSGMDGGVSSLVVYNGELYAGGYFNTAGGISAINIAKWNGTDWSPLGTGVGSSIFSLAVYNSELYAGGWFTTAGGSSANHIAKWNGTDWSPLGSGIDSWVRCLAVYNGELYAGGHFTAAGGNQAEDIAKWNGTNWSPLGTGMNGWDVESLAVYNGELYAGGSFTAAGGVSANYTAKWSGGDEVVLSSSLTSWSPEWHHFAVTYNGSSLVLYLDGLIEDSVDTSISAPANDLRLLLGKTYGSRQGGNSGSGAENFNGSIDEFRIYSRSLDSSEILRHYQSEFQKYNPTQYRFYNNVTNLTDGTYTYYWWANDTAGNSNQTETRTLTVNTTTPTYCGDGHCDPGETHANCPSDCPYDSGGRGGTYILKSNKVTVTNKEPITRIEVNLNKSVTSPSLKVEALTTVTIPKPAGIVYRYIKMTKSNFDNSIIEDATIEFRVNDSWVENNEIVEVYMAKYENRWVKLKPELINKTENYTYYRVYTDSFSYFAIVGEKEEIICEAGEKRCSGSNLEECMNNIWIAMESCEYGCDPATLACNPEPTEIPGKICGEGGRRCIGDELQECRDNKWTTIESCEYGCNETSLDCNPSVEPEPDDGFNWSIALGIVALVGAVFAVAYLKRDAVQEFLLKYVFLSHNWHKIKEIEDYLDKIRPIITRLGDEKFEAKLLEIEVQKDEAKRLLRERNVLADEQIQVTVDALEKLRDEV